MLDSISWQGILRSWRPGSHQDLDDQAENGNMSTPISVMDWWYQWVQSTLRRPESIIPTPQGEAKLDPSWLDTGPDNAQLPPPAGFPLRSRPRAFEYLKVISDVTCIKRPKCSQPRSLHYHRTPLSLLVDNSSAFSTISDLMEATSCLHRVRR